MLISDSSVRNPTQGDDFYEKVLSHNGRDDKHGSLMPQCLSDVNDESVISTFGARALSLKSNRGKTMLSRVAPQLYSDADKVRQLIAEYVSIDVKQVTDKTHLTDDLGLDWLDQLELLILIEDEFVGIEFFANTTAHFELVGDLIRQIEQRNAPLVRRSAA